MRSWIILVFLRFLALSLARLLVNRLPKKTTLTVLLRVLAGTLQTTEMMGLFMQSIAAGLALLFGRLLVSRTP
jgi:hypothetical protein